MNIIVHFPQGAEDQHALSKKVATVHAQTVAEIIQTQACPSAQKQSLFAAVGKNYKERAVSLMIRPCQGRPGSV